MKRTILFLLGVYLSVIANAQIQTKFWGLELSEYYPSLESAIGIISDRCEYTDIEDNTIVAMDGKFGGYEWKFVYFAFYNEAHYKVLYNVRFSDNHKNRDTAMSEFESLAKSLKNKYGEPPICENSNDKIVNMWIDEDGTYSCMLQVEKGTSKGGDLVYLPRLLRPRLFRAVYRRR